MRMKRQNGYAQAPTALKYWLGASLLASLTLVLALFLNQPPQAEG